MGKKGRTSGQCNEYEYLYILLLVCCSGFAQDFEADLEGNLDRIAGCFHSYEAAPGPQTPAPGGYKPFYVSHYGRHGSLKTEAA